MPLYVADYLGDTTHLTTEEHGAYLLILMAMWRAGGRLPSESAKLARFARLTPAKWAKMEQDILAMFDVRNDEIGHKRLELEFAKYTKNSEARAKSGAAGGKAKALKNLETGLANGVAKSSQPEPEPEIEEESPNGDSSVSAETSLALSAPIVDHVIEAFTAYNLMAKAHGLPVARSLDGKRRAAIRARLKEVGIAEWTRAIETAPRLPFLLGENDRGWRADLEFFTNPKKLQKVLEGSYERSPNGRSTAPTDRAERERDAMVEGARQAAFGRGAGRRWEV